MSRSPSVPPNFDALARPYRLLEYLTFGRALHRARTHFLPELAFCRRALILGDGDGRFTALLLARNPHLRADAVDLSPAMLRELTRRARAAHPGACARLSTHCIDALAFVPEPGTHYDLIVTHFFLDCLATGEVNQLCRTLRSHMDPQAIWLVSDFRVPTGPLHLPARLLIRLLYFGFRLLTGLRTTRLPDYASVFSTIQLRQRACHLSLAGILTSELWQPATPAPASHSSRSTLPTMPTSLFANQLPNDPLPDPEPASPSLPEPDPGVFHHEPGLPPPSTPSKPN